MTTMLYRLPDDPDVRLAMLDDLESRSEPVISTHPVARELWCAGGDFTRAAVRIYDTTNRLQAAAGVMNG